MIFRQKSVILSGVVTKSKDLEKSGFTLMELLVYMAIVGIIVVIAGEAFSNSTKFRVRTQNMLKATQEAENVATLFKADVAQMGAKSSKEASGSGGDDTFELYTACSASSGADCIYMDPNNSTEDDKDLSSYKITAVEGSAAYDNLTVRRVRYDGQGHFLAIEQIDWYMDVANKVLKRSCKLLRKASGYNPSDDPCSDGASSTPDPVDMATGVEKFKVYPGIPTIRSNAATGYQEEKIFPAAGVESFKLLARDDGENIKPPTSISAGGTSIVINGFARNYDDDSGEIDEDGPNKNEIYVAPNEDDAIDWDTKCQQFSLEPGIEYEISFTMAYGSVSNSMILFVAGRDHMAVGFRKTDGTSPAKISDFLFYPPTNDDSQGKRVMRFSVPEQIDDVCMAFTFATYSPMAGTGTVTISNLKFRRVAGYNYTFDASKTVAVKDKKNVKALKLELQIARGGKNNEKGETGETTIVVPTPSNGVED